MADIARPSSLSGAVAALFLLGMSVAILVALGRWQLHRADERRALLQTIKTGRAQTPLTLSAVTPPAQLTRSRRASAYGIWQSDLSILLENRNLKGQPGYWLATPLLLDDSERDAVLVLRGWLPRQPPGRPLTLPLLPPGRQLVQGELAQHVPRVFELWSVRTRGDPLPRVWPPVDGTVPRLQNVELESYGRATGLNLLPAVLMQTHDLADGLVRDWPQPSVDANRHLGYALQWFCLAALAGSAWLVMAAHTLNRLRADKR